MHTVLTSDRIISGLGKESAGTVNPPDLRCVAQGPGKAGRAFGLMSRNGFEEWLRARVHEPILNGVTLLLRRRKG